MPQVIAVAKATLHNPPKVTTETAIRQNRGAIAFYESGFFELAGEDGRGADVHAAAAKVVAALKDYQKFLEDELLPKAKGEWRLGKEKFARKLELELDAGLTADEVLAEAEKEFARVERDMYVIARQLWAEAFPEKPLPPDDVDGRRETIRRVLAHFNQRARQAGGSGARRPRHGGPHQDVHRRQRHPAAAGPRPLPGDRDAGVPARQLGGLPQPGARRSTPRRPASTPSARRRATGTTAA